MPRHRKERSRAGADFYWRYLVPATFIVLWSAGYTFAKLGLAHAGVATLLALRYGLVVIVLLPLFWMLRPPLPVRTADWVHVAVVGFFIQVVFFGFTWSALTMGVSAGTAALIFSLQPILVGLLAPRLTREQVGVRRWAGLALGLSGAALVIFSRSAVDISSAVGICFCVIAVLGMTAATLYEKRFGVSQHLVTSNLIQCGVGFVVFVPLAWVFEGMRVEWTGELFVALGFVVFFNSLISITLLLAMIRRRGAAPVSSLFFLVPPTAALIAWVLLGETMPALAWAGVALATVGVAIASQPAAAGKAG